VHYVRDTAVADRLQVTYLPDPDASTAPDSTQATAPQSDPWDYWVFNLRLSANANGESTSKSSNSSGGITASRVTEGWKTEVSANFSRNVRKFEIASTGSTVEQKREDWRVNSFLVRSLTGRWSAGIRANASSTTTLNQRLRASFEPGVEYNFFPYAESSRRSLTVQYLVGPTYFEYDERTIFNQTEETRVLQSLTSSLGLVQPWGRWETSVTAAQYLHDLERYSVTMFANLSVRVFRGFSVNAFANYAWVRDQLYLSAAGSSLEEILLQQRALETSYRYSYSIGITYRFGSIFNNVVNPRFGGAGGSFVIIG
jgi:hypothetical protein